MSKATLSLAAETEAIREAYAALNRNDIPGFVQVFDSLDLRIKCLKDRLDVIPVECGVHFLDRLLLRFK